MTDDGRLSLVSCMSSPNGDPFAFLWDIRVYIRVGTYFGTGKGVACCFVMGSLYCGRFRPCFLQTIARPGASLRPLSRPALCGTVAHLSEVVYAG